MKYTVIVSVQEAYERSFGLYVMHVEADTPSGASAEACSQWRAEQTSAGNELVEDYSVNAELVFDGELTPCDLTERRTT